MRLHSQPKPGHVNAMTKRKQTSPQLWHHLETAKELMRAKIFFFFFFKYL